MNKKVNVAIVGAGLIGKKRALSLPENATLKTICDIDTTRAELFAKEFNCASETDVDSVINDPSIEAVIISTTNNNLSVIAAKAIASGKHVLVEKPGARNADDLKKVIDAYEKNNVVVQFGYNHRYHPAMQKAKLIIDSGDYGPVLFIRAKYGHGARLGYEKEWRFNKEISGGGQLLDQGCHLIDLVNYFAGELAYDYGRTDTLFWDTALEDAAFLLLKGEGDKKTIASLVTTCLEWKNVFCFEIMLKTAKIQIDGLGRSYGTEQLTLYKMKPEMGPPETEVFTFEGGDTSWDVENKIFFDRILNNETGREELDRAKYVLDIINKTYTNK